MNTQILALKIRQHVLRMTHNAKSAHIGSCLSCADILAVLYGGVMKQGDKFVMGKGHACASLYAVLAECGYFSINELDNFYHCNLCGHASHYVNGVDVSTGSLGHGLSIGCGMALVTKYKVYVLLGEGDLDEGSTWEAAMFASHHRLNNLTVIVDYNKLQALGKTHDILNLELLGAKWNSFGFFDNEIDGHNHNQLEIALNLHIDDRPVCVIANTIKGKGVSFMQDKIEWHYKYPNDEELAKALEELK